LPAAREPDLDYGVSLNLEAAMKSTPGRIAAHTIFFIVVFVIISALAIWLGLGPVVHSGGA
jgi:hypothetical protein